MLANFNIKMLITTMIVFMGIFYTPKIHIEDPITTIAEIPKKLVNVDPKQIHCMAKNIFYEAGGESIKGQAAVARVVLNRVAHGFAKTPCGVIYQTNVVNDTKVCQFSWVCENKGEPNKNSYRYKVAQQVAYDVMANDKYKDVVPKSTLFFHNLTVTPMWPYAEAVKIGNHIFYSKFKKKTNIQPKKKITPVEET